QRGVAAAVGRWPLRRGPAGVVELALPVAAPLVVGVLAAVGRGLGRRRVVGEPLPELVAERGLPLGEGQVHPRRLYSRGPHPAGTARVVARRRPRSSTSSPHRQCSASAPPARSSAA